MVLLTTSLAWLIAAFTFAQGYPTDPTMQLNTQSIQPNNFGISLVTVGGDGCSKGTVHTSVTNNTDGTSTFTIIFDDYQVSLGKDTSTTVARKFCQANVLVTYPPGVWFTVAQNDFTGFVTLDSDVEARFESDFYFQGWSNNKASGSKTMRGPIDGKTYTFANAYETTRPTYVGLCSSTSYNVNIGSSIFLRKPMGSDHTGMMTVDNEDAAFQLVPAGKTIMQLVFWWGKC